MVVMIHAVDALNRVHAGPLPQWVVHGEYRCDCSYCRYQRGWLAVAENIDAAYDSVLGRFEEYG
jgi:hypothetical protein